MEVITEGVNNLNIAAAATTTDSANNKKNRIQVSNTKKPLFFYVNLAKRYMQQHNEVELSALGMAIATVVTIAEILKNNGLAVEKKIMTSTVDMREETGGRPVPKAKVNHQYNLLLDHLSDMLLGIQLIESSQIKISPTFNLELCLHCSLWKTKDC
uniref:DNA/RNA-binding protein Alba-like domain-containing protein n=1 Tax=Populus davidiana TaxID=266767 RepID=A0A6M2EI48_9ROSI